MVASASKNIISAQHLFAIVEPVTRWLKEHMRIDDESVRMRGETAVNKTLDRFAQVIQVGLVTHCVYGNIRKYYLTFSLHVYFILHTLGMKELA